MVIVVIVAVVVVAVAGVGTGPAIVVLVATATVASWNRTSLAARSCTNALCWSCKMGGIVAVVHILCLDACYLLIQR